MWNYEATTTTDWIIAIIAVASILGTILIAYIKYRIDTGKYDNKFYDVDNKFIQHEKRFENMEKDLKLHMENTVNTAETNRKENRDEHQLLFQRIDEIKDLLIGDNIKKTRTRK